MEHLFEAILPFLSFSTAKRNSFGRQTIIHSGGIKLKDSSSTKNLNKELFENLYYKGVKMITYYNYYKLVLYYSASKMLSIDYSAFSPAETTAYIGRGGDLCEACMNLQVP